MLINYQRVGNITPLLLPKELKCFKMIASEIQRQILDFAHVSEYVKCRKLLKLSVSYRKSKSVASKPFKRIWRQLKRKNDDCYQILILFRLNFPTLLIYLMRLIEHLLDINI